MQSQRGRASHFLATATAPRTGCLEANAADFCQSIPPILHSRQFSLCISLKQLFLTVEIFDNKTVFSLFCSSQGFPESYCFLLATLHENN